MTIQLTYIDIIESIRTMVTASNNVDKARMDVITFLSDRKLGFEDLETISLSAHYMRDAVPCSYTIDTLGIDVHELVAYCARSVLTELYHTQPDRKWESPCVASRRLTAEGLNSTNDYRLLYELTLTSIGHGVNQALFGIFRNFREPNGEVDTVMKMIRDGTIGATVDFQCDVIRDFIHGAMFFDTDSYELQARGNYALGLLKMLRGELKAYAGSVLMQKLSECDYHEAVRLTGGLFRLIRRNTRELRCELSFLAIKAADVDSPYIRLITQHARENALEMVAYKTFRKTAQPVTQ